MQIGKLLLLLCAACSRSSSEHVMLQTEVVEKAIVSLTATDAARSTFAYSAAIGELGRYCTTHDCSYRTATSGGLWTPSQVALNLSVTSDPVLQRAARDTVCGLCREEGMACICDAANCDIEDITPPDWSQEVTFGCNVLVYGSQQYRFGPAVRALRSRPN
jgi:hypothetical protein